MSISGKSTQKEILRAFDVSGVGTGRQKRFALLIQTLLHDAYVQTGALVEIDGDSTIETRLVALGFADMQSIVAAYSGDQNLKTIEKKRALLRAGVIEPWEWSLQINLAVSLMPLPDLSFRGQ